MPTFTAIVTAHEDKRNLCRVISDLLYRQTRKPDQILVMSSDIDLEDIGIRFPGVSVIDCPNMNDWGHAKRAIGLDVTRCDYVGWFNHDDSYDKCYIEKMMEVADRGFDVIYCGWSSYPKPSFSLGSSTSGNYIVRTSLAKQVGYTDRHYEADGTFIDKLAKASDKIQFVDEVLYFHNEVK